MNLSVTVGIGNELLDTVEEGGTLNTGESHEQDLRSRNGGEGNEWRDVGIGTHRHDGQQRHGGLKGLSCVIQL